MLGFSQTLCQDGSNRLPIFFYYFTEKLKYSFDRPFEHTVTIYIITGEIIHGYFTRRQEVLVAKNVGYEDECEGKTPTRVV